MANGTLNSASPLGTETVVDSQAVLILGGTFSGSEVVLEVQGADSNWYPSNKTYLDKDVDNLRVLVPCNFRFNLKSPSSSSSVYWEIKTS